jgi:hypothetical protein
VFSATQYSAEEHGQNSDVDRNYYTKQSNPHSITHSLFYQQNMHRVNYLEMQRTPSGPVSALDPMQVHRRRKKYVTNQGDVAW